MTAVFGFDVVPATSLLRCTVGGVAVGDYASRANNGFSVEALDEEETACDNGECYEDGYQFLVHVYKCIGLWLLCLLLAKKNFLKNGQGKYGFGLPWIFPDSRKPRFPFEWRGSCLARLGFGIKGNDASTCNGETDNRTN